MRLLALLLPLLIPPSLAITVHGSLPLSDLLPSPLSLPPTTRIHLRSSTRKYSTPVYLSGSFEFHNVQEDHYVLSVDCQTHTFNPLRVDVTSIDLSAHGTSSTPSPDADVDASADQTPVDADSSLAGATEVVMVKVYKHTPGTAFNPPGPRQSYPILLHPTSTIDYYLPRPQFNPLAILKNPLVWLGLVMLVSVFGLPYLTQLLDPEGVEEMQRIKEQQAEDAKRKRREGGGKQQVEAVEKFQNFDVSGWLAGKK